MARLRPEDCAIDRATDRHGFHEVAGQLLVGGVSLGVMTGLFHDDYLRHALTDERSFRAHLESRERQIVFPEILSSARSPVALFRLIGMDQGSFSAGLANQIVRRHTRHDGTSSLSLRGHAAIDDNHDGGHGIGDDHHGPKGETVANKLFIISQHLPEHGTENVDHIQNDQMAQYLQLCDTQRYFAYRRLLMKLDFIQPDSDPEDVLEKLKSSVKWPKLDDDYEHRCCLKGHMNFLKRYEKSKIGPASSISEYENSASESINSELSLTLEMHLGRYDGLLMEQYYNRMKFSRLARECATQAQSIGVILVGEALPVNAEVRRVPLIKQIQVKFRSCAAGDRPRQLLAFGALATVATAGGFVVNCKLGMDSRRSHG